jgi:hypothetical protein
MDVQTFLCGVPDINSGSREGSSYEPGQDFRICVGPTPEYEGKYKVVGFDSVICENEGETRNIITEGTPDALTTVSGNTIGSKGDDGIVATAGTMAFNSVVTSEFYDGLIPQEKGVQLTSFTCSGKVGLEYIGSDDFERSRRRRRRILANFKKNNVDERSSSSAAAAVRDLQLQDQQQQQQIVESSPFATTIEITTFIDGAESGASTTTTTVGYCLRPSYYSTK